MLDSSLTLSQNLISYTCILHPAADWARFVSKQKEDDLQKLIEDNRLKPQETEQFVDNAFRDGVLRTTGTDLDRIVPPMRCFSGGDKLQQKSELVEKLKAFFDKYFGLI